MTTEDVDQAAWSMAKIGRARQHGLELQSRMIAWLSNEDLRPNATIADDRLSWEVRLTKFDGPPLNEWALILGDAIHNLRSALDVLVWTYADAASLTAKQAKNIAFPVWSEQSKWDENVSRILQTVPPVIVERIKEVQPFQRPPLERPADPLSHRPTRQHRQASAGPHDNGATSRR